MLRHRLLTQPRPQGRQSVALHCAGVPQAGVVATTVCLTPQGVVGWVDTAAVHYELTAYVLAP